MPGTVPEESPHQEAVSPSGLIPPAYRRSALLFLAANCFFWAGLYLYVPVLPVHARSLGASLNMVGIVIAAYSIPQVLLRIPIGLLSDNLRRRKSLVAASVVVAALGALGLGLVGSPWPLFLARMMTGIGAASWVVFTVYFVAYYPPEQSGRAIGLINAVQGGALVVATAGGGVLAESAGARPTFFGAALLCAFGLAALLFTREPDRGQRKSISPRALASVMTHPVLVAVSVMGILFQFTVYAGVFAFVPVYATEIGASRADLGLIMMLTLAFSVVGALASVWICERLGFRAAILWSALLIGTGTLAVPFIREVTVLMAVQVGYGLGRGVLSTSLMALAIRDMPAKHQATAMGVYQATYAVGSFAGPLVSGFIGDEMGLASVFYLSASLSLVIAAMAFLPAFSRRSKAAA
jgi:predicted MFS family arabinose efflux permease